MPDSVPINFESFSVDEFNYMVKGSTIDQINVKIDPMARLNTNNHHFHLYFNISISSKNENFIIKMKTDALFIVNSDSKSSIGDSLPAHFTINAPAIVFPYVRAFLTTFTSLAGIGPFVLPTMNMVQIGKELKDKIEFVEKCL